MLVIGRLGYRPGVERAIELPAEVSSPALARQFVTDSVAETELDALADLALLLVSELVTNAVVHAGTPSVLRLVHGHGRLRVELHDASIEEAYVVPASQNGYRPGGRGVLLIDTLADRWGSEVDEHGKIVWFELVVPPST